jgi:hypothetical protein
MISTWSASAWRPRTLANPRLATVQWQAAARAAGGDGGESALWVDPAEIPSSGDLGGLGRALAAGLQGERGELTANTVPLKRLRCGELAELTIPRSARQTG